MTPDDRLSPERGKHPDPGRPNAAERELIAKYSHRGNDGPPPQVYGWGDGNWVWTQIEDVPGNGTNDPSEHRTRTIHEWVPYSLTPKSDKKRYAASTQDLYYVPAPTHNDHGEPFQVMCADCLDSPVYSDKRGNVAMFCEVCERRRERRGRN